MRIVYKYALPEPGTDAILDLPPLQVRFCLYGTGHAIQPSMQHAGTIVQWPFVWHVYHG